MAAVETEGAEKKGAQDTRSATVASALVDNSASPLARSMTFRHDGRFALLDPGSRPAAIVLRHAPARDVERVELVFGRVMLHDLPSSLDGVAVRSDAPGLFVATSAGRDYRVHAQSLRVHHGTALYGRVLPLARYPIRQRVLWTVVLWCARFAWGQALIRRLRRR
jgi:hypothetical protein